MNGRYTLINLHPTMYLLIHKSCNKGYEFLSHLHPTMYLLIPDAKVRWHHHVINLHPTMYLLIKSVCVVKGYSNMIYIPLCIY